MNLHHWAVKVLGWKEPWRKGEDMFGGQVGALRELGIVSPELSPELIRFHKPSSR